MRRAYKIVTAGSPSEYPAVEKELNALGEHGWRVVGFAANEYRFTWTLERAEEPGVR